VVNGIGEGKDADVGIAGGRGHGILFKDGRLVRKVPEAELIERLVREAEDLAAARRAAPPEPLKVLSARPA